MIDVDPDFLAFLQNEEAKAEDSDTDLRRSLAIDFYNGELFGDEEDGRSQLVTRDVAEVVDYMTVSLLRTVASGDRVVEFEGRTQEQSQYSDDATETIHQSFMRRQKGYQLVHDWIKAGLLEITGIVKTYPEPQPPKRQTMQGVSAIALTMAQQQGIEVIEAEETGEFDENGDPLFNIAVLQPQPPKFCDHAVPNEEFKCAPDARDLDSAVYLAHVPPKTLSDLAKMGLDVDDLSPLERGHDNSLANARDGDRDTHTDRQGANQRVAYREEYVLYDLNGDGVAERLMVQRVGNIILAIDEVEDHPFEDWCPFPMPHRRIGQSLAEKVMDIQRTRSVVLRQTLDGFYLANAPRTYVHEDSVAESTFEDLLTVRPKSIVRYRGSFGPPIEQQGRFDTGAGLTMLEQMVAERESRTGITRLNQGLDADALNKTATGTALMQAQGQQIEEYLARNFAEALARLFAKKLKIMKQYGGVQPLRVDGKFRQVDPQQWDDEMDLGIRVGLGSGRKEQRLIYRQQVIEAQMMLMRSGSRIVTEENLYNSFKGATADAGLGNVNDFFSDPNEVEKDAQGRDVVDPATGQPKLKRPPAEPQPDPETLRAQMQMQVEQAKVQARIQADQAAHQLEMGKAQARMQVEQGAAMSKLQLQQAKMQAEAQLARERAQFEAQLAQAKMQFEQRLAEQKMAIDAQMQAQRAASHDEVKMAENRPGGDLSK